ncbi:integrase catalytic domain-containing protein [Trichonephila inaurata madagascariensis]|uniref:Integrase catalytic domain-containing protein n=1 Tax=Trichonephila inaurata madagascariensis TaxID=2747483 RepID=A0A8X6YDY5_9ARAC|nr:integrase catalytic domain-containing protein [Trichonephila inaurata madagascariensis]
MCCSPVFLMLPFCPAQHEVYIWKQIKKKKIPLCDWSLFLHKHIRSEAEEKKMEGIVERTSGDSLSDSQGFYLPHHAVIRSDKTTSHIRIVFDGSAHEGGQSSLNQSLYTGPNLHLNILKLLLCLRKRPVAFTADVKSTFLQIELDLRDRDFTCFFWTANLNNEPYVLNFTRVLFGLKPSPYLLAATLKHHFKKYKEQYPHTFELLNSSIYVDDLICGQNNVPDALRTTLECLQIFSDAGMLLRKIFGLGEDWDSELPPKLRHKWQQWSSEAEGLTEIKIPRFYLGDIDQEISKFEIHCFSDARKDNPADLLSRGTSAVKLTQNELWWHGPPWLKLPPDHWPNRHRDILDSELCSEELEHRSSVHVEVTQLRESLVDINRFSSFKKLLKDSEFQSFVAHKGIHWKFIVERVPWWGGFYERLVKAIEDHLRKILGKALLTFEKHSTILSEVEVIDH